MFIFTLLFTGSCKEKEDLVPNAYVNFTISLADPEFSELQTVGNYVLVTGGVVGILIYRQSQTDFLAWERNCTYKPSDRCSVVPDSSGLILTCPCCQSKYLVTNGSPMSGEAERILNQYYTSFDGINLRVYSY